MFRDDHFFVAYAIGALGICLGMITSSLEIWGYLEMISCSLVAAVWISRALMLEASVRCSTLSFIWSIGFSSAEKI